MSSPPKVVKKSWSTQEGMFTFDFEFDYSEPNSSPVITVNIIGNWSPIADSSPPSLPFMMDARKPRTDFQYSTESGVPIKGTLSLTSIASADDPYAGGIWGNIYYTENYFAHFEGVMVTFDTRDTD